MKNNSYILPEDNPKNAAFNFKDKVMDKVDNTDLFNSYIKSKNFKQEYKGTLWAEGPCYVPNKDILIWSDIPNNRLLKLQNGTISEFINPSNYINGNTLDNDGNIISCSHGGRCVYKIEENLNLLKLVDSFNNKKLNSPNDVCVKSDNTIWFTDPPYGILSDYEGYPGKQEYNNCYVFRYNPKNNALDVVCKNLDRPNGIAFSIDEKKIYIADSAENIRSLYVFDIYDNKLVNQKLVYDFKPFFSDGFRCDIDGNIWTSAGKGV